MPQKQSAASRPLLVRVTPETYAALQLSQPFVHHTSMQNLLSMLIERYLSELASTDAGFERALDGLRESTARSDGVLARRSVRKAQNRT